MVTLGRDGLGKNLSEEAMLRGLEALQKIKNPVRLLPGGADSGLCYLGHPRGRQRRGSLSSVPSMRCRSRSVPIPGTTEAELIGFAVQHALSLNGEMALIMDIGGGSTEFIIADHIRLYFLDSRKTGVARMSADYVKEDPISKASVKKLEAVYTGELVKVDAAVKERGGDHAGGQLGNHAEHRGDDCRRTSGRRQQRDGRNGGVAVMLNEFEYTPTGIHGILSQVPENGSQTTACGTRSGRQTGGFHCGRTRARCTPY